MDVQTEHNPEHYDERWLSRHRWKVGLTLVALLGGGYWWRRSVRRRSIGLDRVSQQWLAQQEFEAGQHPEE